MVVMGSLRTKDGGDTSSTIFLYVSPVFSLYSLNSSDLSFSNPVFSPFC